MTAALLFMRGVNHPISVSKEDTFAFLVILKVALHWCYISSFSSSGSDITRAKTVSISFVFVPVYLL